jgi:tRNA dimethylallyltransferase
MGRSLIIILGPTAVGKTDYSIDIAKDLKSPIISCDSRQIYREMTIGTAVPSASQLAAVKHYFIHDRSIEERYTAGQYEADALALIHKLFDEGHETLVMAGGSGFYIDAVCNGLDDVPVSDPSIRKMLMDKLDTEGVKALWPDLERLDPDTFASIDIHNSHRVARALEACIVSGRPFSSFKTGVAKSRDFEIRKIGLSRPRSALYDRINRRVGKMLDDGLVDEVRSLYAFRNLEALQTVGYKEIFDYLDGKCSLDEAADMIRRNTRHYAKRQITWWNRDHSIDWISL